MYPRCFFLGEVFPISFFKILWNLTKFQADYKPTFDYFRFFSTFCMSEGILAKFLKYIYHFFKTLPFSQFSAEHGNGFVFGLKTPCSWKYLIMKSEVTVTQARKANNIFQTFKFFSSIFFQQSRRFEKRIFSADQCSVDALEVE